MSLHPPPPTTTSPSIREVIWSNCQGTEQVNNVPKVKLLKGVSRKVWVQCLNRGNFDQTGPALQWYTAFLSGEQLAQVRAPPDARVFIATKYRYESLQGSYSFIYL